MSKHKPETAASLRGIAAQLQRAIKLADESYDNVDSVRITTKQAKRILRALKDYERQESIVTEPQEDCT